MQFFSSGYVAYTTFIDSIHICSNTPQSDVAVSIHISPSWRLYLLVLLIEYFYKHCRTALYPREKYVKLTLGEGNFPQILSYNKAFFIRKTPTLIKENRFLNLTESYCNCFFFFFSCKTLRWSGYPKGVMLVSKLLAFSALKGRNSYANYPILSDLSKILCLSYWNYKK